MATAIGMNQSAYSKIESGASDVSFTKLEKIASILGLKLEDVLSFNEQMVFNVMNNLNGQNGLVINNSISENEKALYLEQIISLKEEAPTSFIIFKTLSLSIIALSIVANTPI